MYMYFSVTSAACVAAGMFMCDSRCLSSSLRCDGKTNCKTGLDEQSCYARAESMYTIISLNMGEQEVSIK